MTSWAKLGRKIKHSPSCVDVLQKTWPLLKLRIDGDRNKRLGPNLYHSNQAKTTWQLSLSCYTRWKRVSLVNIFTQILSFEMATNEETLSLYEEMFSKRFSNEDSEFMKTVNKSQASPPCITEWISSGYRDR